jgi:hypothetical protein
VADELKPTVLSVRLAAVKELVKINPPEEVFDETILSTDLPPNDTY